MSYNKILNYWFPNNDYNEFWFDKTPDKYIKENFQDILNKLEDVDSELYKSWNFSLKGKVAIIIALDQFTRNIFRDTELMYKNDNIALNISKEIISKNLDKDLPLNHRIFVLMPYRHSKNSDNLDIVTKKIIEYQKEFGSSKLLEKFKLATYQSYTKLTDKIILSNNTNKNITIKDFEDILDPICLNYSDKINNNFESINDIKDKELYGVLQKYFENKYKRFEDRNIGISLSGGVDSMVILFLSKFLKMNGIINNVYALHIEYINREESKKETELISQYCFLLQIPLYIRSINYMSRTSVERNFYEEETKKVRFNSYKYLIDKLNIKGFCLGHHFGDLGENVLMNIFNGRDIMDLFVMEEDSIIDDVRLFRPLLNNSKNDIYYIAHKYEVPYLKDSTPHWSCRGVLRKKIIPSLIEQWGSGIVSNLAEIGKKSKDWDNVVNNFILKPIYENISYKKNGCKIEIKENYTELPKVIWMKIFLKLFHNMGCNMITRKNLDCFVDNLSSYLKKETKIIFSNSCTGIFSNSSLYIFKCKFNKVDNYNIKNFNIKISNIEFIKENENRNQITYDNILDGYYSYTEQYCENLSVIDKFTEKDSTKKIFSKVTLLRDFIPKITSGYGYKPTKLAKIEINWS